MLVHVSSLSFLLLLDSSLCAGDVEGPSVRSSTRRLQSDDYGKGAPNQSAQLLVWGQRNGSDNWLMVELHSQKPGQGKVRANVTRAIQTPAACAFALRSHDELLYLDGLSVVAYNLTTRKQLSKQELKEPNFESFDYNTQAQQLQGICQLFRPDRNMSETCWCALDGNELKYVFQLPTDFYGEARPGCVGRFYAAHDAFWYPSGAFSSEKWLVGVGASEHDPVDADWFGVINETVDTGDAYVHDYARNRTYAVQISPTDNSSSQLVEVIRGVEPYLKNNSYPKWLTNLPEGLRLAADGLMDYDETDATMFLIMKDLRDVQRQYLAIVDMNSTYYEMVFETIRWPVEDFQPFSFKLWR